jgi:uncharacterized protein (DUF983 family)
MMHFISHGQRVPSLARRRDASTERSPIRRVDARINCFPISTPPPRRLGLVARRPWREPAQSCYSFIILRAQGMHLDAIRFGGARRLRVGNADLPLRCFLRTSNSSRRRDVPGAECYGLGYLAPEFVNTGSPWEYHVDALPAAHERKLGNRKRRRGYFSGSRLQPIVPAKSQPPTMMGECVMPNLSGRVLWRPNQGPNTPVWPLPSMPIAILRGTARHCPACGQTRLFTRYLKVQERCAVCGAPLGLYPSDDAPPYITMLLVLHIIVPSILILEQTTDMALWVYGAIFVPLAVTLTVVLLPVVKGAMIGILLKLGLDRGGDDTGHRGDAWR